MSEATIDAFLSIRPQYDKAHVEAIARAMSQEGIPFCPDCADWHSTNEEHSL